MELEAARSGWRRHGPSKRPPDLAGPAYLAGSPEEATGAWEVRRKLESGGRRCRWGSEDIYWHSSMRVG